VPPLALVGNLSRDVVEGGPPRIGGGAFHGARALRALGVQVEQHDDVGRVPHDRPEPFFRSAQLGRDDPLLFERLVEEPVLVAEMANGRAPPRHDDSGGQREQGQCDAGQEHHGGE